MRKISKEEYIEFIKITPEHVALIEIENDKVFLKADMEFSGQQQLLCVENMYFQLNDSKKLLHDLEECRSFYAGGITFSIENCENENIAIEVFMQRSDTELYLLVNDNELEDIIKNYSGEVYIAVKTSFLNL